MSAGELSGKAGKKIVHGFQFEFHRIPHLKDDRKSSRQPHRYLDESEKPRKK